MTVTATYSPEDNKIRLYSSSRLDAETFARVKEAGFKWAPKQELFVTPRWTTQREDLALDLAGEIEPEEMTMAERAEMKADRLDALADKRATQASQFHKAARDISERFAMGQPILIGHHSERKARKDQQRMNDAMSRASTAASAVDYWSYRARGVEHFANMKNAPGTRARRIKTLFAELRDWQRKLNDTHTALQLWEAVKDPEQIKKLAGCGLSYAPQDLWAQMDKGERDPSEVREWMIEALKKRMASPYLTRWISHTLNRIGFEQEMQGGVERFSGPITPTLLQMFVREHGGEKPKGKSLDGERFSVECSAPFPAHITSGTEMEMSGDEWRDLMQACGYLPADKKPAKPLILNFEAKNGTISIKSRATYSGAEPFETLTQYHMTKSEYAAIDSGYKSIRLSACGSFRVRVTIDPDDKGPRYQRWLVAVYISDQKPHDMPASLTELENA